MGLQKAFLLRCELPPISCLIIDDSIIQSNRLEELLRPADFAGFVGEADFVYVGAAFGFADKFEDDFFFGTVVAGDAPVVMAATKLFCVI